MTQETWARTPSDKSLLKKKGAILGGTGRTKQVFDFVLFLRFILKKISKNYMLELDREKNTGEQNDSIPKDEIFILDAGGKEHTKE